MLSAEGDLIYIYLETIEWILLISLPWLSNCLGNDYLKDKYI